MSENNGSTNYAISEASLKLDHRKTLILGASGLLGKAILNRFSIEAGTSEKIYTIPWSEIGNPDVGSDVHRLTMCLEEKLGDMVDCDIIVASGLINSSDSAQLRYSNLEFPRNLIQVALKYPGTRCMTFGTIHERFDAVVSHNAYFMSKYLLSQWISDFSQQQHPSSGRILHLRLHTLYGLPLHPRMFLGQIAEALKSGFPFKMSSGEQLREYHHAEDIAECVFRLFQKEWHTVPVPILEINSGEAVRLRDLATAIFREFKREDLLQIGDVPASEGENKTEIFRRSDSDILPYSREPITGVIDTLRWHLKNR
jgi:nucleoside-diphosphate-sugar epimerase